MATKHVTKKTETKAPSAPKKEGAVSVNFTNLRGEKRTVSFAGPHKETKMDHFVNNLRRRGMHPE